MIKKIITYLLMFSVILFWFGLSSVNANEWYDSTIEWEDEQMEIDTRWAWDAEWEDEWFIAWVQDVVNWVLWLLWLIALIVLIWWGFLMVTAAWNEERYQKWFDILKQAGIWLVMIWVAWLIISLIFVVIGLGAN